MGPITGDKGRLCGKRERGRVWTEVKPSGELFNPSWDTEGLFTLTFLPASAGPAGKQNKKEAGAPV